MPPCLWRSRSEVDHCREPILVPVLVKDYIQQICASIMDERFDDILHQANPPFIYAEAYDDDNFMKAILFYPLSLFDKRGQCGIDLAFLGKSGYGPCSLASTC